MSSSLLPRLTLAPLLVTGLLHAQDGGAALILNGGHLFDGRSDQLRKNPGVVLRGGVIQKVGAPNAKDMNGATLVDLQDDETILPGFFDLHAHFGVDLFGRGRVDETAHYPRIFLGNGVTSVFPAGELNPDKMRELRIRVNSGKAIGPRIFNSGPYFGSARYSWNRRATAADIRAEVDTWAARGVRGFKAKGITAPHLRALIDQAHRHGLTVTGHLGSGARGSVNPRDAIAMGIDRVEHFLGGDAMPATRSAYASLENLAPDTDAFRRIAKLYRDRGVYFDATLSAFGYYGKRDPVVFRYWRDERKFFTPWMQAEVERRGARRVMAQFEKIYYVKRKTLKAFYDLGGGDLITLGTDHPSWGEFVSGFGVHRELHCFVLAGIPAAAALRMATINGARALGVGDRLGSIEPGKLADLVVVRGNPLADIRKTRDTRWVVRAGRLHDAQKLLDGCVGKIGPKDESERVHWIARRRRR